MVKSSGSVRLVWGLAIVVTTVIGLLSFSVFVLAAVFGSSSPGARPLPPTATDALPTLPSPSPSTSRTPTLPTARTPKPRPGGESRPAPVVGIRTSTTNPRLVVLIVTSAPRCARGLQATPYAEGRRAIAVRVTQQTVRRRCALQRRALPVAVKRPVAGRSLIINDISWTTDATGRYRRSDRNATPPPASL